jgi:hypothetical protein
MKDFIKSADQAIDRLQAQLIELQSVSSSKQNTKKIEQLKNAIAFLDKQIEDLQKLGA